MQVVIDIPEVFYETLRKTDAIISSQRSGKTLMSVIFDAVAKGTPLPEGHGDLIDVCEFSKYLIGRDRSFQDLLKLIPVVIQSEIIEADKGE